MCILGLVLFLSFSYEVFFEGFSFFISIMQGLDTLLVEGVFQFGISVFIFFFYFQFRVFNYDFFLEIRFVLYLMKKVYRMKTTRFTMFGVFYQWVLQFSGFVRNVSLFKWVSRWGLYFWFGDGSTVIFSLYRLGLSSQVVLRVESYFKWIDRQIIYYLSFSNSVQQIK